MINFHSQHKLNSQTDCAAGARAGHKNGNFSAVSTVPYLVALALLDGTAVTLENVPKTPSLTAYLSLLKKGGAQLDVLDNSCGGMRISTHNTPFEPLFSDVSDVCGVADELSAVVMLALVGGGRRSFCNVAGDEKFAKNILPLLQKNAQICGGKVTFSNGVLTVESNGILGRCNFYGGNNLHVSLACAVVCLHCGGGSIMQENFSGAVPSLLSFANVFPKSFVLLGSHANTSLSPLLMRNLASHKDVCCTYNTVQLPADVSDEKLLEVLKAHDGANVTMPFKVRVAQLLGCGNVSVNTVVHGEYATSTDGYGILKALENHHVDVSDSPLWIVGAGGAARACLDTLLPLGCKIQAFNLDSAELQALQQKYNLEHVSAPMGIMSFVPECPYEQSLIVPQSAKFVFVAAYRGYSGLAQQAQQRNITYVKGLEMLYHQGAKSFALWTGTEIQNDFDSFQTEVENEDTFA